MKQINITHIHALGLKIKSCWMKKYNFNEVEEEQFYSFFAKLRNYSKRKILDV